MVDIHHTRLFEIAMTSPSKSTPASRILARLFRGPRLYYWYHTDSLEDQSIATRLIEEGRTHNLGNGYSVRWDRGLQPNQQDHLHIRRNGRDMSVVNRDGTGSHGHTPDVPHSIRKRIDALGYLSVTLAMTETASNWDISLRDIHLVENLSSL